MNSGYNETKDKPYIDYGTKNKSFVDMANYLKFIGIKNHNFMLTLYDYDLHDVDPYDLGITNDDRTKIIKESINNIWYYLREVVRLPVQGGEYRQYQLNLSNMAQAFLFIADTSSWVTIPGHHSVEMDTAALLSWPHLSHSTIRVIDTHIVNAMYSANRIKDIIDLLPSYLQLVRGHYNITATPIKFNDLNKAKAIARSLSQDIIWVCDAEYIPNIDHIYNTAYDIRYQLHRIKSDHNCMLFTSDVSDADNGQNGVLQDSLQWKEEYFDMTQDTYSKSALPLLHIKYLYKQLGGGEWAWFEK